MVMIKSTTSAFRCPICEERTARAIVKLLQIRTTVLMVPHQKSIFSLPATNAW